MSTVGATDGSGAVEGTTTVTGGGRVGTWAIWAAATVKVFGVVVVVTAGGVAGAAVGGVGAGAVVGTSAAGGTVVGEAVGAVVEVEHGSLSGGAACRRASRATFGTLDMADRADGYVGYVGGGVSSVVVV